MKIKNMLAGFLVGVIAVGGSASAFAASEGTGNILDQLSVKIETIAEGDFELPEGATPLNKEVSENLDLSMDMQTYDEGEMPELPEGATLLNKEVIEDNMEG